MNENSSKEGKFKSQTKNNDYYEVGFYRLWDTKGIELSNNSDSNTVLENVKTIIKDSNVKRPD